ncbi:hypothetical protein Scep_007777 [Stephania cephalantha]|uniref:Myosin motor domain-containing protein n=1 Tax=Stephania cephalantha TaxID=152367 RepID=A0AAP0PP39_9MAGN
MLSDDIVGFDNAKGTVLPANPNILEDTDDLVQLSFLNEPSVLHNLCCRYSQSKSYTKARPILLAMNLFKGVEVCGNELVSGCRKKPRVSPDIYYWAKDAFIAMMNDEVNQSWCKMELEKLKQKKSWLECLTNLGSGSALEEKLRHTHVILEAFGNAKTSKQANSSQFGKLIDIHFKPTGKVFGAKIQTCKFHLDFKTSSSSVVGDVHFSVYSQFVNELHLASAS